MTKTSIDIIKIVLMFLFLIAIIGIVDVLIYNAYADEIPYYGGHHLSEDNYYTTNNYYESNPDGMPYAAASLVFDKYKKNLQWSGGVGYAGTESSLAGSLGLAKILCNTCGKPILVSGSVTFGQGGKTAIGAGLSGDF
jgi:hypothetical protein